MSEIIKEIEGEGVVYKERFVFCVKSYGKVRVNIYLTEKRFVALSKPSSGFIPLGGIFRLIRLLLAPSLLDKSAVVPEANIPLEELHYTSEQAGIVLVVTDKAGDKYRFETLNGYSFWKKKLSQTAATEGAKFLV